jgi:hypothetical protein
MLALLPHPTFTTSQLKAHPLGAPHVPRYEAITREGRQVLLHELALIEAMTVTRAQVVRVDGRMNGYASRLSKAILNITGDDRAHPLYTHYFEKPLNQLIKPVLRAQLETMRKWHLSLAKSPQAELSAMAPELAALLAEADAAAAAWEEARQQNREFRDVGERRQWVDRLNAAQKEVYGALAKLPYENPGLPSDFADQFFLSEAARDDEADEAEADTVEALDAEAASLREALAQVEANLSRARAAEEEQKKAAEAHAAQEAELAELDRAAAELEQKRAALRTQLAAAPS